MKKHALLFSLLLGCVAAHADPFGDAVNAWERKDFAAAHKLFTPLAERGNAEAQWQLGEMIGFGEGVPENPALAAQWLAKAQAAGHPGAAASLQTLRERAKRKDEIAFYTQRYDGAELSLAARGCKEPVLPEGAHTKPLLKQGGAAIDAWTACYNGFVAGLNAALPVGKAIPPAIASVMSTTELDTARARMDRVYTAMAADASNKAASVDSTSDAWLKQAESLARNEVIKSDQLMEERRKMADVSRTRTLRGDIKTR